MGLYFEGGLYWCYNGLIKIWNSGPILGDHRIYLGPWALTFCEPTLVLLVVCNGVNKDFKLYFGDRVHVGLLGGSVASSVTPIALIKGLK